MSLATVADHSINRLFEAAADALKESICNALCTAKTFVGGDGHTIETLPLDNVKDSMGKYL